MKKRERGPRKRRRDKNFVGIAEKVFLILDALGQHAKSGLALEEITQAVSLPKTSVHRLLYSMVKIGYVEQDPLSNLYALSGKFFELGRNALPYQRLTSLAKPFMQTLLLTFGESVNLAIPHEGVAVYILVLESPKPHRVAATVGEISYLHCTSVGKSIAAFLPPEEKEQFLLRQGLPRRTSCTITARATLEEELEKVRAEGVAVDNEENTEGIICVGAPIFAGEGRVIAALSISGPSIRVTQSLVSIKTAVRETGQKISMLLGASGIPKPENVTAEARL